MGHNTNGGKNSETRMDLLTPEAASTDIWDLVKNYSFSFHRRFAFPMMFSRRTKKFFVALTLLLETEKILIL